MSSEEEKSELFNKIIGSKRFAKAHLERQLLQLLWENRDTYLSETDIAEEIYDEAWNADVMSVQVRTISSQMRARLADCALRDCSGSKWRFVLPPASGNGYRLKIVNITNEDGMTAALWRGHLEPACAVPLVVSEPAALWERRSALGLEGNAGDDADLKSVLCPFVFSGEVRARSPIGEWFADAGVKARMKTSRDLREGDVAQSSPIFFGDVRTNSMMQQLLGLKASRHLAYRFDGTRSGAVVITGADDREGETLGAFGEKEPRSIERKGGAFVLVDQPEAEGQVFVLFTRIPKSIWGRCDLDDGTGIHARLGTGRAIVD